MKPRVYWFSGAWWAELDYDTWRDSTPFGTWRAALDHALWLRYINRGARS